MENDICDRYEFKPCDSQEKCHSGYFCAIYDLEYGGGTGTCMKCDRCTSPPNVDGCYTCGLQQWAPLGVQECSSQCGPLALEGKPDDNCIACPCGYELELVEHCKGKNAAGQCETFCEEEKDVKGACTQMVPSSVQQTWTTGEEACKIIKDDCKCTPDHGKECTCGGNKADPASDCDCQDSNNPVCKCTKSKPKCVGKCVPIGEAKCPMTASSTCTAPVAKASCAKEHMTAKDACGMPVNTMVSNTSSCNCEAYQKGTCRNVLSLTSTTSDLARWWMVQGYPLCCDFAGSGKACSSGQACLPAQFATGPLRDEQMQTGALMGDGAVTRTPRVLSSTRPSGLAGQSFDQKFKNFRSAAANQQKAPFVPRTSWVQVCIDGLVHNQNCPVFTSNPKQPGANWFKPRFGHSIVVMSGVRVVLYGGFTCPDEACRKYTALSDAWEIDLNLVQSTSEALMTLRELTPTGTAMGGVVAVSAGASNLVYVTGGSNTPFEFKLLAGEMSKSVPQALEIREIMVFESKMNSLTSTHWPALSAHSAVANASTAIMFGGFIGNTMTSAAFTVTFSAPTGNDAFAQVKISGRLPEARGYSAMEILGSEAFLLVGGVKTARNNSGIGSTRVALGDLWNYSFVTAKWSETQRVGNHTSNAFGASSSFVSNGLFFFFAHGGVSEAYVPGVSAGKRWRNTTSNPYPYGPGVNQPTAEMKVLLPETWVKNAKINRWIRVRPKTWDVKCMSIKPLSNKEGDDYWRNYSAPYPWWISVVSQPSVAGTTQNLFKVAPCTWAPPTVDANCAQNSDPETQLCTTQLPPSMICEPSGRFMHSLTVSSFKGGKNAAVLYGGIDMYNQLLADAWMYDLTTFPQDERCKGCGFLFRMRLRVNVRLLACSESYIRDFKKITKVLFSLEEETYVQLEIVDIPDSYTGEKKICEWTCNSDPANRRWELKHIEEIRPKDEQVTLIVSVTEPDKIFSAANNPKTWANQWKDAMSKLPDNMLKNALTDELEVYPLLGGNTVTLKDCYKQNSNSKDKFFENCLRHKEARVEMMQLGSGYACKQDCTKGVCQFKVASRYEDDQVREK